MRPSELRKLFRLEDSYWWYIARRELVRRIILKYTRALPRPHRSRAGGQLPTGAVPRPLILDIGCGGGAGLVEFGCLGRAIGLDRSQEALRLSRSRGDFPLVRGSAERLPFASDAADVVTALDVVEHIRDDWVCAAEMARVCRPGGIVIITVPAYQSLWSEHDEALDHIRRYRAGQVRRMMEAAGMRVLMLSYCITALLPAIFGFRLAQKLLRPRNRGRPKTALRPLPPLPNRLLVGLLRLETAWLLRVPLPAGVSVVCAAQKPTARREGDFPPGRE